MRKQVKIWLMIAASCILTGCVLFAGVMTMLKWDFTKLSTHLSETNNHVITKAFSGISIRTDTADIALVASQNAKCSVVCDEQKNQKHSVTVTDDTLIIEVIDTRKWYEYISIYSKTPKITVYLPKGEYGCLSVRSSTGDIQIPNDFKFEGMDISASTGAVANLASVSHRMQIKTSTGNIHLQNISAGALDLSVSTGNVDLSGVTCKEDVTIRVSTGKTKIANTQCKSLISNGSTGDISLEHVIATERFSLERSTGDVIFNRCDATQIITQTSTGDVSGSLLSQKIFITETNTGDVSVPKTATGGRCEITTSTGDINIDVAP